MARLQKIKDTDVMLFRSGGESLENCCVTLLALKMKFARNPYVKNSPINIRDASYGGRTEATKTYYRV